MRYIIIILVLTSYVLPSDVNIYSSEAIAKKCRVTYDDYKIVQKNVAWCDAYMDLNLSAFMVLENNNWCRDNSWTPRRWKFAFLSEVKKNKTDRDPYDIFRAILNRKHKCPSEVI